LLKASQPKLCFQCNTDVKPSFSMPFHHKVNEGLVKCSDCHDVHGTFGNNNLKSTADQNRICTKCHSETRGPFVYEHAPVKLEGCMACHQPHGSAQPALLKVRAPFLCQTCHEGTGHPSIMNTPKGLSGGMPSPYLLGGSCLNCHSQIHGSNHPSGRALMR